MYQKDNRTISMEEAQASASHQGMSVEEWATKYGWTYIGDESGKENGSTTSVAGTEPQNQATGGTESVLGDGFSGSQGTDVLEGMPMSYRIQMGYEAMPGYEQEFYTGRYGDAVARQDQTNIGLNLVNWDIVDQGATPDDIHGVGHRGEPTITTAQDISNLQVALDLDLESKSTNTYFNKGGSTELVNKYYNGEFLASLGIDLADFEGFLKREGFDVSIAENIDKGIYAPMEWSKTGITKAEHIELFAARERALAEMLTQYVNETQTHDQARHFIEVYNADPSVYDSEVGFDGAFGKFLNEEEGVAIYDYQGLESYIEAAYPNMLAKDARVIEAQKEHVRETEAKDNPYSTLQRVSDIIEGGFEGFTNPGIDLTYWFGESVLGHEGRVAQQRLFNLEKGSLDVERTMSYGTQKAFVTEYNGKRYALSHDGEIFDTELRLNVTGTLTAKEYEAIKKQAEEEDNEVMVAGRHAYETGAMFGDIAFQLVGTRGFGKARLAASSRYLAATKGFGSMSKFYKYKSLVGKPGFTNMKGLRNTGSFGKKLPFDVRAVDNVAFQSFHGATSGYSHTMDAALAAGLSMDEAEDLANTAMIDMAILYGLTGPLNPRLPALRWLDDIIGNGAVASKAINEFIKHGKNKAVWRQTFVNGLKTTARVVKRAGSAGAAEMVQENVQQLGEVYIVNDKINRMAGEEILQGEYSQKDFVTTSAMSFIAGGLIGAVSTSKRFDRFKPNQRERIMNLFMVGKDLPGFKGRVNEAVKAGKLTRAEGDELVLQAAAVAEVGFQLPSWALDGDVDGVEVAMLVQQLRDNEAMKKRLDVSMHGPIDARIAEIRGKLAEIGTEASKREIVKDSKRAGKILGKDKVKIFNTIAEAREAGYEGQDLESDGMMVGDGEVIINLEVASRTGAINVASHEVLHNIMRSEMKNNPKITKVINEFRNILHSKGVGLAIEQRLLAGGYDVTFNEDGSVEGSDIDEYMNMFADAIALGEVDMDALAESEWMRLGRAIVNFFRSYGGFKETHFKSGQEVFNFIKDFQSDVKKGKLSATARAKRRASKGIIVDDRQSISRQAQSAKEVMDKASEDMDNFDPNSPEIAAALPGMIDAQLSHYANKHLQFDQEEVNQDVLVRLYTEGDIAKFDGRGTLYGYLNGRINFRIKDAFKQNPSFVEDFSQVDVADQKGLAYDEATPEQVETRKEAEKPVYKNLLERKVVSPEVLTNIEGKLPRILATLKSRIDEAVSKNRTVAPIIAEIRKEVGKQADIDIKKAMGGKKDGQLRKWLTRNKTAILENMTTTWLRQAMPIAVQGKVDGRWTSDWQGKKLDRETTETDRAGRTSGTELIRRLPQAATKISDADFLALILDPKTGNPLRGKKESLAKAIAEELSFDIINEQLQNSDSEIYQALLKGQVNLGVEITAIQENEFARLAERGNVKFSKTVKGWEDLGKQELFLNSLNALKDPTPKPYRIKAIAKQIFTEESRKNVLAEFAKRFAGSLKTNATEGQTDVGGVVEGAARFYGVSVDQWLDDVAKHGDASLSVVQYLGASDYAINLFQDEAKLTAARAIVGEALDKMDPVIAKTFLESTFIGTKIGDEGKSYGKVGFIKPDGTRAKYPAFNLFRSVEDAYNQAENADKIRKAEGKYYENRVTEAHLTSYLDKDSRLRKNQHEVTDDAITFTLDILEYAIETNVDADILAIITTSLLRGTQTALRATAKVMNHSPIEAGAKPHQFRYDHNPPVSNRLARTIKALLAGDRAGAQEILKNAEVNIISVSHDKALNAAGVQRAMTGGFVEDFTPIFVRNFGPHTWGLKGIQRLISYETNEEIGVEWEDAANSPTAIPLTIEAMNRAGTLDKLEAAVYRKRSITPKKIRVFDFDDTIARSKSKVLYTLQDGTKGKLTPAQFAERSKKLSDAGAIFDFSEFDKVIDGKKGPLFKALENISKKRGTKDLFILTARPPAAALSIRNFLLKHGVDVPLGNIVGLADGKPEAKAEWMAEKALEGYNDFYFTDDHAANVKAVKAALEEFDVKSKTQQAKIKFSKTMHQEFNEMIERQKNVSADQLFSRQEARFRGAHIKGHRVFVPSSADDLRGLTAYTFSGKGKQGNADMAFWEKALIDPYIAGKDRMDIAKQRIRKEYKALVQGNKDTFKKLEKRIGDTHHTYDHALRVFMWDQQGLKIPDLTEKEQAFLVSEVRKDPVLVATAMSLKTILRQKEWIEPEPEWYGETIVGEMFKSIDRIGRKRYLAEFLENMNEIFSPENMNKIEALYGTRHREALEDMIFAATYGTNRPSNLDDTSRTWMKWLHGAVGSIMFLNRRSAVLQTISTVNFINWSDNNVLNAGKAFANQKQYWSDFALIFNSPKLKERRGGLQTDVIESEIANAARGRKNKPAAIIAYLLKIGFTPTQIADSFAIAAGGSAFYRNRVNTYLKQGLDKAEAESKAWLDFSKTAEEAQQSSDPIFISQQQRSPLGRLILAFANTPMQYTRLMKKAGQDIIHGRGDLKTNISKIVYYGAVQNIIFASLQNALFAFIPGFDDDDEWTDKKEKQYNQSKLRILNSMSDSILRGSGIYGAAISAIKNAYLEWVKQEKKGFTADHTYTLIQLLNVSPPIGSKAQKLYSAQQTAKFDKDVMNERGWSVTNDGRLYLSPEFMITGKVASATVNLPMDRAVKIINTTGESLDSRNTAWQRIFLALGWDEWNLMVENEEYDLIKAGAKEARKKAGIEKAKETRARKKAEIAAEKARIKKEEEAEQARLREIMTEQEQAKKKK